MHHASSNCHVPTWRCVLPQQSVTVTCCKLHCVVEHSMYAFDGVGTTVHHFAAP
jgi:hypothetical protein